MKKNSKIYIAGHRGLLGTSLQNLLKQKGYINLLTISRDDLDLTDQRAVERFFFNERPEYVFLCAGLTGGIIGNRSYPVKYFHNNISIQDNIFEATQKYEIEHLIFYGSSCMYPKNSFQPIKEDYILKGPLEETSEAYAMAKMAGIIACKSYNKQFNTKRFIALVPNSIYGPNDNFDPQNAHVLSSLIRKIHEAKKSGITEIVLWGSGAPRREFVYVDDVADASIFAMENAERLENMHYNIGTARDSSIKELADEISTMVGFEGDIKWDTSKPDGTPRKLLDSSNFIKLGWKPSIDLSAGLKATYEWYLRNIN